MAVETLSVDKKNPILKKDRISTGIEGLDIILEGGYLKSGLVMLIGPTGMEKNAFAYHFAVEGIKNKEIIIYINADSTKKDLLKKSSSLGFDINKEDVIFIDCYSKTLGGDEEEEGEKPNEVKLSGPSALNDLSLAVKDIIGNNPNREFRVIFHSLSTFLLYNPQESIIKFLQVVGGRLREEKATALFLVEEGMHEKKLVATIEHMMDEKYVVHDSGNFSIEVPGLQYKIPLRLSSAGIEVI
ncbi:hypothetical protein JXB01_03815 [Candidatus Micrarchaeota archaeon]|nr:hypothetical protein [Candidatus Micrarchaeota archaeon]